jgi:histidine ammonia-lyase
MPCEQLQNVQSVPDSRVLIHRVRFSLCATTDGVSDLGHLVTVGVGPLTIDEVVAVARHDAAVVLDPAALVEVARSREIIESLADDIEPHYGVSTGFGALATRHIALEDRRQLQRSLIRSHAAGMGARRSSARSSAR